MGLTPERIVVGRIATFTGGPGFGWVEALAIAGRRIVATGSRPEIEALAGPRTRRLDLAPTEVVLPGLTDAHLHLLDVALAAERVDLSDAPTLEAAMAGIAAASKRAGGDDWIEGGGWDPNRWGRWPTAVDLEQAAPGRRVAVWAHDHHALLVSRRALAEAAIGDASQDPPGGRIRRDAAGVATGVLHEHASRLVSERIPPLDDDRTDRAIESACRRLLALGIVAAHDMGTLAPDRMLGGAFGSVGRLDARGGLPIRVHAGIREESLDEAVRRGLRTGVPIAAPGAGRARVGWWKRFADGSLGSRTAYLRAPYEGGSDRGILLVDPEGLRDDIARAARQGIVSAVHAIGDAALDVALDALAPIEDSLVGPARRVEHAQLVHDDQLGRLARAGIALSMQPYHAVSDGPSIGAAWGARARRLGYRWRSAIRSGVALAFGSDAPVESPNPWRGIAAAIDRSAATLGEAAGPLDPREALTLDEALRAACLAPARLAGERDRGRLIPGERADLVVVPLPPGGRLGDPVVVAALRPRLVLVDGEVGFEA
ncbi:MAG TPA: amidohydrolase [Candidatus Limnocylindrales bacterium]|nr:amidohydrolase [Candidatus Limnocylindrales bacterium]